MPEFNITVKKTEFTTTVETYFVEAKLKKEARKLIENRKCSPVDSFVKNSYEKDFEIIEIEEETEIEGNGFIVKTSSLEDELDEAESFVSGVLADFAEGEANETGTHDVNPKQLDRALNKVKNKIEE